MGEPGGQGAGNPAHPGRSAGSAGAGERVESKPVGSVLTLASPRLSCISSCLNPAAPQTQPGSVLGPRRAAKPCFPTRVSLGSPPSPGGTLASIREARGPSALAACRADSPVGGLQAKALSALPPPVSPRGTAQRSGPTGRVELEGRRRLALQEAVSQGGRQPRSETGSHQPAEGRTAGSGRWDLTMSIFTAFEGWRGLEGTPCLLPTRSKPAKSSSAQPWPRGFAKGQLRL